MCMWGLYTVIKATTTFDNFDNILSVKQADLNCKVWWTY